MLERLQTSWQSYTIATTALPALSIVLVMAWLPESPLFLAQHKPAHATLALLRMARVSGDTIFAETLSLLLHWRRYAALPRKTRRHLESQRRLAAAATSANSISGDTSIAFASRASSRQASVSSVESGMSGGSDGGRRRSRSRSSSRDEDQTSTSKRKTERDSDLSEPLLLHTPAGYEDGHEVRHGEGWSASSSTVHAATAISSPSISAGPNHHAVRSTRSPVSADTRPAHARRRRSTGSADTPPEYVLGLFPATRPSPHAGHEPDRKAVRRGSLDELGGKPKRGTADRQGGGVVEGHGRGGLGVHGGPQSTPSTLPGVVDGASGVSHSAKREASRDEDRNPSGRAQRDKTQGSSVVPARTSHTSATTTVALSICTPPSRHRHDRCNLPCLRENPSTPASPASSTATTACQSLSRVASINVAGPGAPLDSQSVIVPVLSANHQQVGDPLLAASPLLPVPSYIVSTRVMAPEFATKRRLYTPLVILCRSQWRRPALQLAFIWFFTSFAWYGVIGWVPYTLYKAQIDISLYLQALIVAAAACPGNLLVFLFIDRIQRYVTTWHRSLSTPLSPPHGMPH